MLNKTSWKQSLRPATSILSIDIGLGTTGYAVLQYHSPADRRLLKFGSFSSDPDDELVLRANAVAEQMRCIFDAYRVTRTIIEQPPETVYNQGRGHNYSVARGTAIFKTFAVLGAVYSVLRQRSALAKIDTVLPVHWQPSKKQRQNLGTKEWSLNLANILLKQNYYQEILTTKTDENIADAICMAWILTT